MIPRIVAVDFAGINIVVFICELFNDGSMLFSSMESWLPRNSIVMISPLAKLRVLKRRVELIEVYINIYNSVGLKDGEKFNKYQWHPFETILEQALPN